LFAVTLDPVSQLLPQELTVLVVRLTTACLLRLFGLVIDKAPLSWLLIVTVKTVATFRLSPRLPNCDYQPICANLNRLQCFSFVINSFEFAELAGALCPALVLALWNLDFIVAKGINLPTRKFAEFARLGQLGEAAVRVAPTVD
jgi:hypothetical protein